MISNDSIGMRANFVQINFLSEMAQQPICSGDFDNAFN